jgi:VanZ family protein
MKKFINYWLPPVIWMIVIFPANKSLTSENTSYFLYPIIKFIFPDADAIFVENAHKIIRKLMHFFDYAFLAFLLFRGFRGGNKIIKIEYYLYSGLIAVCYGMIDEIIQTFIPKRTGSIYDWIIDSAGAILSLAIIYFFRRNNLIQSGILLKTKIY